MRDRRALWQSLLAVLVLFVGVGGVVAVPAGAEDAGAQVIVARKCRDNPRTFALPASADISVNVRTCVWSDKSCPGCAEEVAAGAEISWSRGQPRVYAAFDSFKVIVRLERSDDVIGSSLTCEVKSIIGSSGSGSYNCSPTNYANKGSATTWTGDGWVSVDINNDGKGRLSAWELTGSPAI